MKPYPQRFIVLGRAPEWPTVDLGTEKLVQHGGDHFLVIVTTQELNGDLHAVGGGRRLIGQWSWVLDNDQGLRLKCWSWRDE